VKVMAVVVVDEARFCVAVRERVCMGVITTLMLIVGLWQEEDQVQISIERVPNNKQYMQ
jgi:hypothetical protein